MSTKVGDSLWQFDINRREYTRPEGKGRLWGEPIYRGHFREHKIVGEEKRSWLISAGLERTKKIAKSLPRGWYTIDGMEAAIWIKENRHEIAQAVGRCDDVEKIRTIKALLELLP